jgi:hypothetical protein
LDEFRSEQEERLAFETRPLNGDGACADHGSIAESGGENDSFSAEALVLAKVFVQVESELWEHFPDEAEEARIVARVLRLRRNLRENLATHAHERSEKGGPFVSDSPALKSLPKFLLKSGRRRVPRVKVWTGELPALAVDRNLRLQGRGECPV